MPAEGSVIAKNINIALANSRLSTFNAGKLVSWSPSRVAELEGKANSDCWPAFVRTCARGQLAARDGDFKRAFDELYSTLLTHWDIFPSNDHLFSHVFQLVLSTLNLDLISYFLNIRFDTGNILQAAMSDEFDDLTLSRVSVDRAGNCTIRFNPTIVGADMAEYYISHWLGSVPLWAGFCQSSHWVSGSLLMNYGDAGVRPGVAFCANSDAYTLVPDNYFMGSGNYSDLRARFKLARPGWADKVPRGFWRGATSGLAPKMDWRTLPRIQLCEISRSYPELLDVGISHMAGFKDNEDEVSAAGLLRGRVQAEAFLPYKYQIDIDGYSNSWPGLIHKLLTGSPVLKICSSAGYTQWYYGRLRPWVNFVPVSPDMSDLIEKVRWLQNHDDVAERIGEAGLRLVSSLDYGTEMRRSYAMVRVAMTETVQNL